jgi:hypothetical protein
MRATGSLLALALGLVACAPPRPAPQTPPVPDRSGPPAAAPVGATTPAPGARYASDPTLAQDAAAAAAEVEAASAASPAPTVVAQANDGPSRLNQITADACAPEHRVFCAAALRLARHDGARVVAWGTIRLDGSAQRYRFATVQPNGLGRGRYLIERTPSVAWLLTFKNDGRTQAFWGGGWNVEPTWRAHDDTAMLHVQSFHRGGESFQFGVRGGDLVALNYSYDDIEIPTTHVRNTYVRGLGMTRSGVTTGGRCVTPCPTLAGYPMLETELLVEGPRATSVLVGDD